MWLSSQIKVVFIHLRASVARWHAVNFCGARKTCHCTLWVTHRAFSTSPLGYQHKTHIVLHSRAIKTQLLIYYHPLKDIISYIFCLKNKTFVIFLFELCSIPKKFMCLLQAKMIRQDDEGSQQTQLNTTRVKLYNIISFVSKLAWVVLKDFNEQWWRKKTVLSND